jgi:hypothetical protein
MGKRALRRVEIPPRYTQQELLLTALWRILLAFEQSWDGKNADLIHGDIREFLEEPRDRRYDGVNFNDIRGDINRVLQKITVR